MAKAARGRAKALPGPTLPALLPSVPPGLVLPLPPPRVDDLIDEFLRQHQVNTRRAYLLDLKHFARFLEVGTPGEAFKRIAASSLAATRSALLGWRQAMKQAGLSPATRNRRLAAVRSFIRAARSLGACKADGTPLDLIDLVGEPVVSYRDTRGLSEPQFQHLLGGCRGRQALRDKAIIRLARDLGLRRAELRHLDLADLDVEGARVWILGKRRTQKEAVSLPTETLDALHLWLMKRGLAPGPLFPRPGRPAERLSGEAIRQIVRRAGIRANLKRAVWPHALRHTGATRAAAKTGGNVLALMAWGRWKDAKTAQRYVDNLADAGGQVAKMVAKADQEGETDDARMAQTPG
jgi:integrase/recombinase XerC